MRFILIILLATSLGRLQAQHDPTFEEILSLRNVGNPQLSPDGNFVVYEESYTDWENNAFKRELWVADSQHGPRMLTMSTEGSSRNPKWSPDGQWIAYLSSRTGKNQVYVMRFQGGEGRKITDSETGINDFEWSPDGKTIALLQTAKQEEENHQKRYGDYAIEDEKYSLTEIWTIPFSETDEWRYATPEQRKDSLFKVARSAARLFEFKGNINSMKWSPDGKTIAFDHQPDPLINSFLKSDISLYDLQSKTYTSVVSNPSTDYLVDWSPDGDYLIYGTAGSDTVSNFYKNGQLFKMPLNGSEHLRLGADFDEQLNAVEWNAQGIFALAWQKTERRLVTIDAVTGVVTPLDISIPQVFGFSFSKDGQQLAYAARSAPQLTEIYTADFPGGEASKITSSSGQIENWNVAQSEVIQWKSNDGTQIEGVLHKPENYDPTKKYPLLVIIHGGPTGISLPEPTPSYVYPMVQWLNKGALILRPNYRGSAGYGEAFRSLNVRNLGVGDAWDVESGVKHLSEMGLIDENRVGAMGWSQGGYISAFLTTNSNRFKAISVGAGISNWMTYYVNTDIHPFTRQYLKATPWIDMEIYEKTSPMTNILKAQTPTLIQHGEFDRRVPPANAFELYQGLQDMGVETRLIIYKGFGHGITKPKERLAAQWHNWQWFGQYIWREEIELPEDE